MSEFVPDASTEVRRAARQFCLDTIREVYGTEYRPDWHADLDSLLVASEHSWFSRENRGAFWSLHSPAGEIVATAGLYRLAWKPNLTAAFADRYPSADDVAQLVRVYVRKDQRGRGIGQWLSALAEAQARRLGFPTLYLHANTDTEATIAFWRGQGFSEFAAADGTTHFDKVLKCGSRMRADVVGRT
jgi:GNAT superfamily N-acetyltransferase